MALIIGWKGWRRQLCPAMRSINPDIQTRPGSTGARPPVVHSAGYRAAFDGLERQAITATKRRGWRVGQ
jgi:hypothetical protein